MKRDQPILLISSLPPPHGGIATWTKKIMQYGLPDNTHLVLVDTKIQGKRNASNGKISLFRELVRTTQIFMSLIYQLLCHRPKLVHISCSLSPRGIFRDFGCAVIVRLFNIPLVSHYRGNVTDYHGERVYFSKSILKALMRVARANIVENQLSLIAIRDDQSIRSRPIFLLPNFVDDAIFEYKMRLNTAQSVRCSALFVGAITRNKGCADILAVAKQLPEIDFYLLGQICADMETDFKNMPNNIILLGPKDHHEVLKIMHNSDFLFFPTYSEGFPLSVVEAMSAGLPVIATRVGAIPEMIEEGRGGFLVAPANVAALVNAIKKFITDPSLKVTMGAFNRLKCFNDYRYSVVSKQLLTIYNEILYP